MPDAPAAAAPATSPAPAAPATTTATPAPAAATPAAAASATPAPAAAAPGNLMAEAKPAPATPDEMRAFLTEKGGKAEELAALDEAALKAKFDEAKTAEAKPAAEKAATDFEVKAPEGVVFDEAQLATFKTTLADPNLSLSDKAAKLVEMHATALKQATEAPMNLWFDTQKSWQAAWKADPELGGANFEAVTSTIAKALDTIGGGEAQKIREAFMYTGAGNNPEIGRMFYRMAKALTEGGMVSGGKPPAEGTDAGNAATLTAMYPSAAKVR